MRFHMGVSFNMRKLKKFIIPFLIGLMGFFGFSLFKDNKIISPGVITVLAEERENEGIDDIPSIETELTNNDDEKQNNIVINEYDDSIELQGLSNKIYWFQKPNNYKDVLINIYVVLFLFVIGYFVLKFLVIIHNVKWNRGR